jgi:hypothetical protein
LHRIVLDALSVIAVLATNDQTGMRQSYSRGLDTSRIGAKVRGDLIPRFVKGSEDQL